MKHLIGHTKNEIPVTIDLINSEGFKNVAQYPHLLSLTAEVLKLLDIKNQSGAYEHDMGREVGYDYVVETSGEDGIFYAKLIKEQAYTRFVKKRQPHHTEFISFVLEFDPKHQVFVLQNVWIGRLRPPKPGSKEETKQSKTYWSEHALIFDHQPLQYRTLTKSCPY